MSSLELIARLPVAVLVVDALGTVLEVNPSARRLMGHDVQGRRLRELVHDEDAPRLESWLASIIDGDPGRSVYLGPLDVQWRETARVVDLTGSVLLEMSTAAAVLAVRDLTAVYAEVHALVVQAQHDGLTGLLNRGEFARRAERLVRTGTGSLLYLDIDGFKGINDSFGHMAGDMVLAEFGSRVSQRLGPQAVVARLGGDEFVALLPGTPLSVARGRALRLTEALRAPVAVTHGEAVSVTVSVGLSNYDGRKTLDDALREADLAMYAAKGQGKDQVVSIDEGLQTLAERRASLIDEINALRATAVHYSVEARTDPGTGLPNLRRLLEDLALVHDRASRSGTPYCLLFLDLDHFGALNKKYGDAIGDKTLVAVAQTLTATMRDGEIVYRKGGEELVVVLWETSLDGGVAAAHRYRQALVDAALAHGGHPQTRVVTASFGVAEGPGDGEAADVLRTASLCMLSAKAHGRNSVSIDPMPVPDHPESA